jgi:type VI secretion system secreted protein Hcp
MALSVHLKLKANGVDIEGDSTITSMDRENTIECLSFEDAVLKPIDPTTLRVTGRTTFEPIIIVKRVDRSSPLLAKALCNNESIEGVFRFYRPNPAGDGTTEQHFTVEIGKGLIESIERISPNVLDPDTANDPDTEEVSFVFGTICWRYEDSGVEHTARLV